MKSIVKVESKRILKTELLIVFFAAVLILSVSSNYQAVKSYELWDRDGFVASGRENLKHGKENEGSRSIEEAIVMLKRTGEAVFVDESNIEKLVSLNYSDREAADLSDEEINSFFENRIRTIKRRLDENSNFNYSETEKEMFMKRAEELTGLRVGFAEGWKNLNRDISSFIPFSLLMISIIIMPLFADDAQTKMKELSQSTINGKRRLDLARITTAFGVGSILYFVAVIFYFFAKMIPFGFSGGGEYIQSNEDTFFSVFHITYAKQFVWNCSRGYIALIFVVSMTILISVLMERIMAGIVVVSFYWILLLIMEKIISFEVNHVFANFMPLRLSGSKDFYTHNEIYRFAGKTFDAMIWCPAVAIVLSAFMVGIAVWWLRRKTVGVKKHMI
ncbi:MAG: hypothetical protein HFI41_08080 [Lachnospiraceae bacterium]|nr:hypothetical protein [Lachnospiraceae bacterium]